MQVRPAVSPVEVKEAISLSRSRKFWTKFLAIHSYIILITVAVVAADVVAISNHRAIKLQQTGILLATCVVLLLFSWYRTQGRATKILRAAGAKTESLSLDSDGVRTKQTTGATSFLPWSSYTNWIEGKNVFLLKGKAGTTIIAVDAGNRDAVRSLLTSQIASVGN